jgi:hypothetical protein
VSAITFLALCLWLGPNRAVMAASDDQGASFGPYGHVAITA